MTSTECPTCTRLNGLAQCNSCRANNPNRQTTVRRELARRVREEGMTPAEAEASLNVTAGPTVG